MKKRQLLSLIFACLFAGILAQSPQKFSYQAVARNMDGTVISNSDLHVKIGIIQGSKQGEIVWSEYHLAQSNKYGLFSLIIGNDDAKTDESLLTSFSEIDWGRGPYFINIKIDDGSGYTDMGTNELLSVPFSLFSLNGEDSDSDSTNELQTLSLSGNTLSISSGNSVILSPTGTNVWTSNGENLSYTQGNIGVGTEYPNARMTVEIPSDWSNEQAIFQVINDEKIPIFSVYNNGVQITFDEKRESKGLKGGFAVGGYKTNKADYLTNQYLRITTDTTRLYINTESPAKGLKGGFAVGGYKTNKGESAASFLYMDPSADKYNTEDIQPMLDNSLVSMGNCYVGTLAGQNRQGVFNTALGYQSLYMADTSIWSKANTSVGALAGYSNKNGFGNVYLGFKAGYYNNTNNKLYISNTDTELPLIWGDFAEGQVIIHGHLSATGGISKTSDARFKTNLRMITNVLPKLNSITGYHFSWNDLAKSEMSIENNEEIGVLAQELEKEFPSLVSESEEGYKTVDYMSFTAVLLQAIKEQQKEIEELKKANNEINELRKELEALKKIVSKE